MRYFTDAYGQQHIDGGLGAAPMGLGDIWDDCVAPRIRAYCSGGREACVRAGGDLDTPECQGFMRCIASVSQGCGGPTFDAKKPTSEPRPRPRPIDSQFSAVSMAAGPMLGGDGRWYAPDGLGGCVVWNGAGWCRP